jgi:hypothetical protein
MPLDRVPPFAAAADYAVSPLGADGLPPLDVSYDMWLTADRWHGRGNQICRTAGLLPRCSAAPGVVEVMVWLYAHDLAPTGGIRETLTLPASVRDGPASVWKAAPTRWNAFVDAPKFAVSFTLAQDTQRPARGIAIDLRRFLQEALRLLHGRSSAYYLESIDLGSEFATNGGRSTVTTILAQISERVLRFFGAGFGGTQAHYVWRLEDYCFVFTSEAPRGCAAP